MTGKSKKTEFLTYVSDFLAVITSQYTEHSIIFVDIEIKLRYYET